MLEKKKVEELLNPNKEWDSSTVFSGYLGSIVRNDKFKHNDNLRAEMLESYKVSFTNDVNLDDYDVVYREVMKNSFSEVIEVVKNETPLSAKHLTLLADGNALLFGCHMKGNYITLYTD